MSDKTKLLKRCLGFVQGGVSGYRVHVLIFTPPSKQSKKRHNDVSEFFGEFIFFFLNLIFIKFVGFSLHFFFLAL